MSDKTLTENDDNEAPLKIIEVAELPGNDSRMAEGLGDDGDDDDDDDDDDSSDTSSKNRKKREKRRKLRKLAQERAERELALLREQNDIMAKRLAAVEGHAVSQNEQTIDQRLTEAQRDAQNAELIMARAIEAGNGDDVATALRMRDEAKFRASQLENVKQQVTTAKNQPAQVDPRVKSYAKEWMDANPWYKPNGADEASAVTNVIDKRLIAEGYDPRNIDYWQELTNRVASRFGDEGKKKKKKDRDDEIDDTPSKKKAPPMGNSREHAPASTKKGVYVTPERKQAMIDAGIWEDPVRRNQMLKAYQAYDRNSAR